jgi:DNA-binding MarR family transcriptional regulator
MLRVHNFWHNGHSWTHDEVPVTEKEALEEQLVMALRRIARATELHSRQLSQQCGLTAPQLLTLQAIARLGSTTISALAKAIHLSQATLTGILDRLAQRNLIERTRNGTDRRTVNVVATPLGLGLLADVPPLVREPFLSELYQLPQWEQTQLLAALQRIAAMMEQTQPAHHQNARHYGGI